MKLGSDNFRESAIIDIIEKLINNDIKIIIFEPRLNKDKFMGLSVIKDLNKFLLQSDLIVANRNSKELDTVKDKIYTRDIFNTN